MASELKGTPLNFLYLFERMSEPMGYGVRGRKNGMVYFYYEDQKMMDEMVTYAPMKDSMKMIWDKVKKKEIPAVMVGVGRMSKQTQMPNLDLINKLCPKITIFSYFIPAHKRALALLREAFMDASNTERLFELACVCRDSPKVNCQLFVFALSSCLAARNDTKHFRIPGHYEIMPANYCEIGTVRMAHKMAHIPDMPNAKNNARSIMANMNFAGTGTDPEQKMWYFREDLLVNNHHFHWHVVFPTCSPKDDKAAGYRDRRGELFYYMHHSMIARYDTERLCNGLARTQKFNFQNLVLEEGYFGKLSSENSNIQWGTRQAFTRLTNVERTKDFQLAVKVEELERWRDRILETIDLGYYIQQGENGGSDKRVQLDDFKGIDILGNIIESSETLSPHLQYYGAAGFHNMGHVLIAFAHDPKAKFKEQYGVMGDVAAAMRDPAFYRWHKYIDYLFDTYKRTLAPYPLKGDKKSLPLIWEGIELIPGSVYLQSEDSGTKNVLKTYWSTRKIELGRGLDFQRDPTTGIDKSPIIGQFVHLNHSRFDYFMQINNKTNREVWATIRIFMAPRNDENKEVFKLDEQRLLYFEMDKVSQRLRTGRNDIIISSTNSSITLRDEMGSSFDRIETLYKERASKNLDDRVNESQCSCGWPQHLLLPRGSPGIGEEYDVFVIVTDGEQDKTNVNRADCKSALSFCGILNQKYPDARPMGYPFDRTPYLIDNEKKDGQCSSDKVAVNTIEEYASLIQNAGVTTVRIVHEPKTLKMDANDMEEDVMCSDGRCIKMKDYFNMPQSQGGTAGRRPTRPEGQQFPDQSTYNQYQWGGVSGRQGQRRSREPDDDWEELRNDWY